jgi:rubrerythrin
VLVSQHDQRGLAEALLDEFEAEPVSHVEEPALLPDLSRVDSSLAPLCPSCGVTLPMDASRDRCPGCHAEVDITALIVAAHGPEALVDCYPDAAMPVDPAGIELTCAVCDYALAGLGMVGRCPECGEPYDKDAIIRSMLGDGW